LRKKLLARLREEGVLVVMIDLDDKEFLIRTKPAIYFSTPHYDGYPAVLVRLDSVKAHELELLIAASWRFVAPPSLAADVDPGRARPAPAGDRRGRSTAGPKERR
jgi:hypothetical protein